MINLMPPIQKEAIMYARRNSVLVRWMVAIILAAAGIVIVAGGGMFYLKQDTSTYAKTIEETTTSLQAQEEEATLKRVEELRGNLSLVVDVLSSQVLFSQLIQRVGAVMPSGTILQDLSISSSLDGGLDLLVIAADEKAATQVQVNLSNPENAIFSKADIISLSCATPGEEDVPGYPCSVSIRALYDKENNPFLLLNQTEDN